MENELKERLLHYLSSPGYKPQDASAIARGMGVQARERPLLRALLRDAEEEGRILRLRQARYALPEPSRKLQLTGRIARLAGGSLLFRLDAESAETLRQRGGKDAPVELPLHKQRSLGAMDGDMVRASLRLSPAFQRRGKGRRVAASDFQPEIRVEEILHRRSPCWVGTYHSLGRFGIMQGDGRSAPERVRLLEPPPPGLLTGMRIVVEPHSYPRGNMEATGRVQEVLGWPEDGGVAVSAIIHQFGLATEFPEAVLKETRALSGEWDAGSLAHREDWRTRCVITIDPDTARDFDDAISVRDMPGGGWELAVHIADVSHYVRPGSALDREARQRGNSTYLPDRVLPMLPPRLCDDLCSLKEGEDRLTCLCLLQLDDQGRICATRFARAIIRSRRRLDYASALAVLEERGSTADAEVDAMLTRAHQLASLLRRRRFEQGALELDQPELHVLVDASGVPCGVKWEQGDISHQLIEEFMLAANEAVARALREHMLPGIYRVHEEPDPAKLHEFSLTVKNCGIPCGTLASRDELRRVMESIRGHRDEEALRFALLRSLMRARYSPKPLGHYGLAKGDYCHFTSPIRRYADLIVHRSFARLCGERTSPLPRAQELENISEHISETERLSARAEQEAERQLLAEYLRQECESDSPREWQAIITASWPQGLAIELPELRLKGFISGADLPADARWFHEPHTRSWCSTDGRRLLPGTRLPVIPLRVDAQAGFLDCRPV